MKTEPLPECYDGPEEADAMKHKPRSFLSDSEGAVNFKPTDSVPAVQDHPHCGEPLIQTNRRVLKDSPDLHREPPFRVMASAPPAKLILEEANLLGATGRTYNTFVPLRPTRYEVIQAVLLIRKIQDRFLQALRLFDGFHDPSVRQKYGLVKYIFALIWALKAPL